MYVCVTLLCAYKVASFRRYVLAITEHIHEIFPVDCVTAMFLETGLTAAFDHVIIIGLG